MIRVQATNETPNNNYLTVRQLSELFPAFPQGGIRAWIFSNKNGFATRCVRRVGKKILINIEEFESWIESNNCIDSNI